MKALVTYPEEFLQRMKALLPGEYDAFIQSLDTASPVSVRLNPYKQNAAFANEEKILWCENGRYLKERPSFTFDPLFQGGAYYVQEASSMFIEQAWKQIAPAKEGLRVLDMCAAPGGKSTHLLSLMGDKSLLITNEIIPNRNKILQQNIIKWGNANCIITQNKPDSFAQLENYFDIILIDAPCSGEGLFRKDKEAISEWSEKNVALCSVRQKGIVENAWACLKPGGYLIYSTCTFEPVENDDTIEKLAGEKIKLAVDIPGITKTKYGYQFYPHKIKGEGFYMAVVKKEGESIVNDHSAPATKNPSPVIAQYLSDPTCFTPIIRNELIFAIPNFMMEDYLFLEKQLYIRNAGLLLGTEKGKDFLPSHDLALSNELRKDIPVIELSYDDAIIYLRGEAPKIKSDLRGWCIVTYQGLNLGWIKVLDNRVNNYFPKDWRILKRA